MTCSSSTLLLDTCVVSDIINVDAEIVSLIKRYIGPVYVPDAIVKELLQRFDLDNIEELGLETLEVSYEMRYEAQLLKAKEGFRKLSEQDASCLLAAQRMNCVCVTNDLILRRACVEYGVSILWELEVILKLCELDGITYDKAERYVETLNKKSAYIADEIVAKFNAELNKLRSSRH